VDLDFLFNLVAARGLSIGGRFCHAQYEDVIPWWEGTRVACVWSQLVASINNTPHRTVTEVMSEMKTALKDRTFHLSKCHALCFSWKCSVEICQASHWKTNSTAVFPIVVLRRETLLASEKTSTRKCYRSRSLVYGVKCIVSQCKFLFNLLKPSGNFTYHEV
jgi:hypothetical protein